MCKKCGYYGCEGDQCAENLNQERPKEDEQANESEGEMVEEEGQEFLINKNGLINMRKTEQLFIKRGMNEKSLSNSKNREAYAGLQPLAQTKAEIPVAATRISNTQQAKRDFKFLKPGNGNIKEINNRKSQNIDPNIKVQTAS